MYCATVLGMNKEEIQGAWAAGTKLVPNTPKEQTLAAIEAVFKSWNNDRAKFYRKMHNIPEEWGTAVVLQAMVFGNMGETSCTGVLFTRNPDTGSAVVTGEFLVNAQGEDVVAGVKTPQKLLQMADWNGSVYLELLANVKKMEDLKGDVQDVEFTVQEGKLYILQTRNAKRTPMATVRIAVDYFQEGKLSREEALKRVKVVDYDIANQDVLDPSFKDEPWVTGIPACSGVVTGKVVLSAQAAVDSKEPCILITKETTPDDIAGMFAAKGVVTMEGGATSHAAVVARGMNKPCVVGVGIDVKEFAEGSTVSFDGATGRIWLKEVPVVKGSGNPTLKRFDELLFGNNVVPVGEVVNSKVLINGNIYISDPQALAQLIAKVPKGTKVFLDLTDHDEEIVNEFNSMFYLHGAKMDVQVVSLLANLNSSPLAKTGNLTVFVSGDYVGFPNLKLVVGAGKLEQFLMANGGYWVGDVDPAVMKLMDLKTKAGEKCGVLGAYSEKDECFQSKSSLMARLLS
jgi:phosphohistidine swiveling domain-containing protein